MNTDTSKPIVTIVVTLILGIAARLGFQNIPADAVYTVVGAIITIATYLLGRKHGATASTDIASNVAK